MSIKLLIVDDSPFIRKAIAKMIQADPEIVVIGEASNGREAVEKVAELKPDVVTLDIEMPIMNGIDALKIIMKNSPLPVVMVSSLTEDGAKITLEALKIGAIDYLPKDIANSSLSIMNKKQEIIMKIKTAYQARRRIVRSRDSEINVVNVVSTASSRGVKEKYKKKSDRYSMVVIGTSTGGPPALEKVIAPLPSSFSLPILIVQHMPPVFTRSLADRLNSLSQIGVKEAEDGEMIRPGQAYIAPGDFHMTLRKNRDGFIVRTSKEPSQLINRPSVDVLFESAAEYFSNDLLAVIMTGMGHDGLQGTRQIRNKTGTVIAQDEETCVVFGMPGSVVKENLADYIVPLQEIAPRIMELVVANETT
ncbi:MAG: chemotaxis response regulator protein-glutamate methylesterase [Candidatus Delongbacteria bacterium]|nr:chemotaxis response regulator protein-glutamate methylesterase [Candidatus Delongbacteria bacterium]